MSVISLYSFLSNKIDDVEFDEEQLFQHISEVIDREDMKVRKRLAEICRKWTQNSKENGFFLKKHMLKEDSLLITIILDKSVWDSDAVVLIFYNFCEFSQK